MRGTVFNFGAACATANRGTFAIEAPSTDALVMPLAGRFIRHFGETLALGSADSTTEALVIRGERAGGTLGKLIGALGCR